MSEIEKMYENAEVKKQIPKICSNNELYCKDCKAHIENAMPYCENAEYPQFTAEKQIELIKWLARQNFVVCKNLGGWHAGINPTYDEDFGITCSKRATNLGSFEYAIAGLVNTLWQDLTEEERKQIKEILE